MYFIKIYAFLNIKISYIKIYVIYIKIVWANGKIF